MKRHSHIGHLFIRYYIEFILSVLSTKPLIIMKKSGIMLYFIIITTLCFLKFTGRCSSTLYCPSPSTDILHRIAPRRALGTFLTQLKTRPVTMQISDALKHSPVKEAFRREQPLKSSIDDVDNEKELVYHVDYQGVTTHPSPNPKHGKP